MFHFLHSVLLSQNQFASGGLLLMVVGSIGVFLRALPGHLWTGLIRQTTMMITVKDEDAAFGWVKEWFLEQEFVARIRQVDLDTTVRGQELALIPAPGVHFFWFAQRPFWVWFSRSDDARGRSQRRVESLTFRTLGRDQLFLKRFVGEIVSCHQHRMTMHSYLHVYDDYWCCVESYSARLLDSVILKPGEKERLLHDLERFRESRERYRALGVPYHRGYLFHGPPGTGKTSLVSALAGHFGMSVYAVNLTDFNDRALKKAIHEVPANSVILFEDIDCMRAGDRRPEHRTSAGPAESTVAASNAGVTLAGLLNVLDGFHAPSNVVFVMTTNKVDALDPALLRPGRIDYKLFLGEASESQKIALYERFFPSSAAEEVRRFAESHRGETMAEFQGSLLASEQRMQEGQAGAGSEDHWSEPCCQ